MLFREKNLLFRASAQTRATFLLEKRARPFCLKNARLKVRRQRFSLFNFSPLQTYNLNICETKIYNKLLGKNNSGS